MASSSSQRAAGAPPSRDQLATFYKLVDKQVTAGVLCRHARYVDLSAQAATQAEALFGDDSLVVSDLRYSECCSLNNLASEASGAEKKALLHKSWAVLLSLILQRRLADNTLLPGTIREVELDYEAHAQAAALKARNDPVPPPFVLRTLASTMGYNTLLMAIFCSLKLLPVQFWTAAQKRRVESFVLQGLDVIPRTAGIPLNLKVAGEKHLAAQMEHVHRRNFAPSFFDSMLRKWRSDAVSNLLRARGVLQTGIAKSKQSLAEFDALQRADVAKHGLRNCALPSCSKTEKTVKEFSLCAGCRSQVYCCLEHQALDWKAHKKACREKEAARLAEEEAEVGG